MSKKNKMIVDKLIKSFLINGISLDHINHIKKVFKDKKIDKDKYIANMLGVITREDIERHGGKI